MNDIPRPAGLDALLDHVAARLPSTFDVLGEVAYERRQQDTKWGEQNHPDGTGSVHQQKTAELARSHCEDAFGAGYGTWADILAEEVAEAEAERDPAKLRAELLQVAAVAVCWIEAIDRRADATTHGCPPDGSGLTSCCRRTPFELPTTDRMTEDSSKTTCTAPPADAARP